MNKMSFVALFAAFLSPIAVAHYPVMECSLSDTHIDCQTGFSDGSTAPKYKIELFDYDDNLIAREVTNEYSKARFERPEGEFYLVFDAGHEAPVEIDVVELQ
ncbi:hypothetical protein [Vibrio sp. SCSIO 43136]|uniref:hypothetical protein n=1 Tax=Vibrio sp. SCSIO 43136 TaxID=2819101 RepID=UPI002075687D|nr:hypothetical protein [Vibrio sp. SCSIO 43136]USD67110.1 hypothetical protein J4N39_20970 [Vibrio sp. SCSIO 43136]